MTKGDDERELSRLANNGAFERRRGLARTRNPFPRFGNLRESLAWWAWDLGWREANHLVAAEQKNTHSMRGSK